MIKSFIQIMLFDVIFSLYVSMQRKSCWIDNVGIWDSACVGYKLILSPACLMGKWSFFCKIRISDVRSARDKIGSISQYPIGFSLRDIHTWVLAMSPTGHMHDDYDYHHDDSLCTNLIRGITQGIQFIMLTVGLVHHYYSLLKSWPKGQAQIVAFTLCS